MKRIKTRKTLDIPHQITFDGQKIMEEAQEILTIAMIKNGRRRCRVENTPFAQDFVELLEKHTRRQSPWLNIPVVIMEKILLYLPAQECWRIARGLCHHFKDWVTTVASEYRLCITIDLGTRRTKYTTTSSSTYYDLYTVKYKDRKRLTFTDYKYFNYQHLVTLSKVRKDKIGFSIHNDTDQVRRLFEATWYNRDAAGIRTNVEERLISDTCTLWKNSKGQLRETSKAAAKDVFHQLQIVIELNE